MPFESIREGFSLPIPAASVVAPKTVVKLAGTSALSFLTVGSFTDRPWGVSQATVAQGDSGAIQEEGNVCKLVAAASLGAGAEVMVASVGVASAAQRNVLATIPLLGPFTVASGVGRWVVGISLDAAQAGETFSCYIKPRLTGGLA